MKSHFSKFCATILLLVLIMILDSSRFLPVTVTPLLGEVEATGSSCPSASSIPAISYTSNIPTFSVSGPSTVTTSISIGTGTQYDFQRKTFYDAANGRVYVMYGDGSRLRMQNASLSNTGALGAWSPKVDVRGGTGGITPGNRIAVFWNGTRFFYFVSNNTSGMGAWFRVGSLSTVSPYGITWSAAEQNILVQTGLTVSLPTISVDSSGYAWVGFTNATTGSQKYPYVAKNSKLDGTWSNDVIIDASGMYKLSTTSGSNWAVLPINLTATKMGIIYDVNGQTVKLSVWGGASWTSEPAVTSSNTDNAYLSATSMTNDDIVVAYVTNSHNLMYAKFTYGTATWGTPITVESSVERATSDNVGPTLTVDNYNTTFIVWAGYPTVNKIYAKRVFTNQTVDTSETLVASDPNPISNSSVNSFRISGVNNTGIVYGTTTTNTLQFALITNAANSNIYAITSTVYSRDGLKKLIGATVYMKASNGTTFSATSDANGIATITNGFPTGSTLIYVKWEGTTVNGSYTISQTGNAKAYLTTLISCVTLTWQDSTATSLTPIPSSYHLAVAGNSTTVNLTPPDSLYLQNDTYTPLAVTWEGSVVSPTTPASFAVTGAAQFPQALETKVFAVSITHVDAVGGAALTGTMPLTMVNGTVVSTALSSGTESFAQVQVGDITLPTRFMDALGQYWIYPTPPTISVTGPTVATVQWTLQFPLGGYTTGGGSPPPTTTTITTSTSTSSTTSLSTTTSAGSTFTIMHIPNWFVFTNPFGVISQITAQANPTGNPSTNNDLILVAIILVVAVGYVVKKRYDERSFF